MRILSNWWLRHLIVSFGLRHIGVLLLVSIVIPFRVIRIRAWVPCRVMSNRALIIAIAFALDLMINGWVGLPAILN